MIEIDRITFKRGNREIYRDFTEQLRMKEAVLFTGPNGAGKSTLIQLIGGILKSDQGEIRIDGKNIRELKVKEQASLRSIAPQRRTFALAYTVHQVLHFLPAKMRIADSGFIIETLGLTELLTHKVTELSIGQQERVSLAIALIQNASYYLLDEPFSAQDTESIESIITVISHVKREKGVLVISHNQDALIQQFDRVISLA